MELPAGTVTMLFTDIEGSTALFHELGDQYLEVLADHHRLMREAIAAHRGYEVKTEGDAFFVTFADAADAVSMCLHAQRALATHQWVHGREVRVRMGVHTGPVTVVDDDYAGLHVHEAARIASAGHGGQVLISSSTAEAIDTAGTRPQGVTWFDLGKHALKDFPEPRQIFQLTHDELPDTFPPLRTLTARDHNLPALPSSLIGRDAEIVELQRLLAGTARLVTVTGAGGLGKTRLAVETAWSLLGRFREGAWLVDLAVITDPDAILGAVAGALRIRDEPGKTLFDTVVERLGTGPMLLVLDNVEHVLDGVTVVAELLAASPQLAVLATSREALRLRGEHELLLDGLGREEAAALFAERARAARRDVVLDATAVDELCERLDGMPLAIELAAARVRTHSIVELLSGMDAALDLLSEGERDLPKRQQAMRAAIAWSVDQLSEAEHAVFRALAVFLGGATPEAAMAVYGGEADAHLRSLAEKSLVRTEDGRFRMLEPIRQFAYELLSRNGSELVTRTAAHARWCCALAEEAEPHLTGPEQQAWLRRLSREHANLRAALDRGEGELPLRLAAALIRFWAYLGHGFEGRAFLQRVLATGGSGTLRGKALLGAGHLALVQGDLGEAAELLAEAVDIADEATAANACNVLGEVARLRGDADTAAARYAEALARAERAGDDRLVGLVRNNQGALAFAQGEHEVAAAHWREAAGAAERTGDTQSLLRPVSNLGIALSRADDLGGASAAFERALGLARQLNDRSAEAAALANLGLVSDRQRDHERAAELFRAALEIYEELGSRREVANMLLSIASTHPDVEAAIAAATRSRAVYAALGDRDGIQRVDETLAEIRDTTRQEESAYSTAAVPTNGCP